MKRLGKILAAGALIAAPLAFAALPSTPAKAQVYFGVGPYDAYACSYYDVYDCPYYGYDYGWPGAVGWGWGGGGWGGGWGYHGGGYRGGWHGGGHFAGGMHSGGMRGGGHFHH